MASKEESLLESKDKQVWQLLRSALRNDKPAVCKSTIEFAREVIQLWSSHYSQNHELTEDQFTELLIEYQKNYEKIKKENSWRLEPIHYKMLYVMITRGAHRKGGVTLEEFILTFLWLGKPSLKLNSLCGPVTEAIKVIFYGHFDGKGTDVSVYQPTTTFMWMGLADNVMLNKAVEIHSNSSIVASMMPVLFCKHNGHIVRNVWNLSRNAGPRLIYRYDETTKTFDQLEEYNRDEFIELWK